MACAIACGYYLLFQYHMVCRWNIFVHLYLYAHILIPIYLYTYIPIYLYTYYLYTYIPIYLYTYVPIPIYLYTCMYLYLYTYTCAHTYSYTVTYTYTIACDSLLQDSRLSGLITLLIILVLLQKVVISLQMTSWDKRDFNRRVATWWNWLVCCNLPLPNYPYLPFSWLIRSSLMIP